MFKKFSAVVLASFLVAPLAHATDITVFAAAEMNTSAGANASICLANVPVAAYVATIPLPDLVL